MKRIALATTAAIVAALLGAAPATAAEPNRVLIVGDSVTQGKDGDYTWRYFAWQSLADGPAVDFVGPRTGTNAGSTAMWGGGYADAAFDTDHAARWGMSLRQMVDTPTASSPAIGDLVAAHDPDVVIEVLGVNDFWTGSSVPQLQDHLRVFVADARSAKPEVDIVLAALPQTWIKEVPVFNAELPALAAELSTATSSVTTTIAPTFVNGEDTYDAAHPTTQGQRKIAASMVDALTPLLVDRPEPPSAPESTVTPATPPTSPAVAIPPEQMIEQAAVPATPRRVRGVRQGVRVVMSWRAADGAERYAVRCGTARKTTRSTKVTLRSRATRCKVRSISDAGHSGWVVVRARR